MKKISKLPVFLFGLLLPISLYGAEPLLLVADPWPPYVLEDKGEAKGMDWEVVSAVFAQLNIPVKLQFLPWKRCLSMVEKQQADGILDASKTQEREEFMVFPEEPISQGITVFFIKKGRPIPFSKLDDLKGLRAGAILGYDYCEEVNNGPYTLNRVRSLNSNFKKLLAGRLDLVIETVAVGSYTAKQMGIADQITIIPNATFCIDGNYIAFSKKPGHDKLSMDFSRALKAFKNTRQYQTILKHYGQAHEPQK